MGCGQHSKSFRKQRVNPPFARCPAPTAGNKNHATGRFLLRRWAVVVLLVLVLSPYLLKVLLLLKMVLAAAKVVFFPYSMLGSRESFVLGYV